MSGILCARPAPAKVFLVVLPIEFQAKLFVVCIPLPFSSILNLERLSLKGGMPHATIEQHVQKLDERVERLERRVDASWHRRLLASIRALTPGEVLHMTGWLLVTVSALSLFATNDSADTSVLVSCVGLLAGLWLVFRDSSWPRISQSTRHLLQEERSARRIHATSQHQPFFSFAKEDTSWQAMTGYYLVLAASLLFALVYAWLVLTYLPEGAWQLWGALLVPTVGLAYSLAGSHRSLLYFSLVAVFLLLSFTQAPLFALGYLTLLALAFVAWVWMSRDWPSLLLVVAGSYAVLARWALYPESSATILMVLLTSLILSLAFVLPFALFRREAANREFVRRTIFGSVAAFVLLPLLLPGNPVFSVAWMESAGLYLLVLIALGLISLMRYGRYSFAKYYGIAALGLLMLVALLAGNTGLTSILWFAVSIIALGLGFSVGSYSVRTVGLCLLGLTLLYYLSAIFPYPTLVPGPFLLQQRIWLGAIFALFLPVLGFWYRDLPAGEPETAERSYIIELLYVGSFMLLLGIGWVGFQAPAQTVFWLVVGGVYLLAGRIQKLQVVQSLAIAGMLSGLGKYFFFDSLSLPREDRIAMLAGFAVLALLAGVHLIRHVSKPHITRKSETL